MLDTPDHSAVRLLPLSQESSQPEPSESLTNEGQAERAAGDTDVDAKHLQSEAIEKEKHSAPPNQTATLTEDRSNNSHVTDCCGLHYTFADWAQGHRTKRTTLHGPHAQGEEQHLKRELGNALNELHDARRDARWASAIAILLVFAIIALLSR